MRRWIHVIGLAISGNGCALAQLPPSDPGFENPRVLGHITSDAIGESSGVAIARANPDHLWTHNDSGDAPRLYLLRRDGAHVATYDVVGAFADDWEDMCSFELDGKPYLLVGDTGDNLRHEPFRSLYLIPEPTLPIDAPHPHELRVEPVMRIDVEYPGGPRDCESVAFDPTSRTILLVTKQPSGGLTLDPGPAEVFAIPLPEQPPKSLIKAEKLVEVPGLQATGADVSPDGTQLIVCTFGRAMLITRPVDDSWADALRTPAQVTLPLRLQGEAICFDADGRSLILTSERANQPIWRVPARTAPAPGAEAPRRAGARP